MNNKQRQKSHQKSLRQKISKGNRARLNWVIALSRLDEEYVSYRDGLPDELIKRFPSAVTYERCVKALRKHHEDIFKNSGK